MTTYLKARHWSQLRVKIIFVKAYLYLFKLASLRSNCPLHLDSTQMDWNTLTEPISMDRTGVTLFYLTKIVLKFERYLT